MNQGNRPRVRLFTEMDAVLDTRYGLLKKYHPETTEKLILTDYLGRLIDEFPGVSFADFKKLYDARGDDALEFAVLSNIHCIITTTLHGAYADSVNLPLTDKPLIILNLWPYKFDEKESANLLRCFRMNYGIFADVTLVNMPLNTVTPAYVKQNVDYLILYNANEWLGHHNKDFETKKLPEKRMICPMLYQDRVPTNAEILAISDKLSPFDYIHKTIAPLIDLNFIDVEAFSVYSKDFNDHIYNGAQGKRGAVTKTLAAEAGDDLDESLLRK